MTSIKTKMTETVDNIDAHLKGIVDSVGLLVKEKKKFRDAIVKRTFRLFFSFFNMFFLPFCGRGGTGTHPIAIATSIIVDKKSSDFESKQTKISFVACTLTLSLSHTHTNRGWGEPAREPARGGDAAAPGR